MKKLYILIAAILLTVSANAQAPDQMTYQAVVRDASNNLVANTAVGIQISILKGSESGEVVYIETQQPTTNTNGLISIVIGTPPNTDLGPGLSQVTWGNDSYFIKTEIDPTGGANYTITGTTQLLSVPYALYAKNSGDKVFSTTNNVTSNANGDIANDDFVFGSKQLDGTERRMFFDKSKAAFRVGGTSGTEWDSSNITNFSFASGYNTIATGNSSTAIGAATTASGSASLSTGNSSKASGDYSITTGWATEALGAGSIAMGDRTKATGEYSTAMGSLTTTESYAQTSLGANNTAVSGNTTSFIATDRLFVIGNGISSSNRSDAMVVLKDGTITAPSLTNELINTAGNKALITKEYIDALKPKTYAIGDVALGGVVIWVDEMGQHGLVCSLDNLSNGIAWMEHDDVNSFNINFTSGNGIGAGKLNTTMILSSNDVQKLSNTNFAALLCATYSKTDININNLYDDGGGTITISYADWYLPSVYELSLIYPNKDLISAVCQDNGGTGLSNGEFWSSNQNSQTAAWEYFMSDNTPSWTSKNSKNVAVRAVRSF